MKSKHILILAMVMVAAAANAQTTHVWQDNWWGSYWSTDANISKYNAQELSLDLFGTYINPERQFDKMFDTNIRRGVWGGGAGVNYFFHRNIGIGTDASLVDVDGDHWKWTAWTGDLYLRLPLGNSGLAPYAFGTGGRAMTPIWQWVYGGGVGLEYRFTRGFGIFSDVRFLWAHESTAYNTLGFRAGLRFTF